ncbi:uncharacterized protein V1510DRAFT_373010 [Dipodascopsis tothii]|uniref:uncharacterized protein n=1 Tax=Dipodascopsis tothii TaxID=44089 RepID=UPI0034CED30D
MAQSVFETSVETAVARSVQQRLPLVVFVSDGGEEATRWAELLADDEVAALLGRASVSLRIENGSTEAGFFGQIFPILDVPSLYVISNGAMADYYKGELDRAGLLGRLEQSLAAAQAPAASVSPAPAAPATPAVPAPPPARSPAPSPAPAPAAAPAAAPAVPPAPAPAPAAAPVRAPAPARPAQPRPRAQPQADDTAGKAAAAAKQEELRRRRQQENEERQRILKLLQDDRKERQTRSHAAKPAAEPARRPSRPSAAESAISVRLFDGSSVKNRFGSGATLADVRAWINEHSPSPSFSMLSIAPHRAFAAEDEERTLVELDLHPSATLVLKPRTEPESYLGSAVGWATGTVSWAAHAVGTFLGVGVAAPAAAPADDRRVRTLHDPDDDPDRRTYNGNHLSLEDDM